MKGSEKMSDESKAGILTGAWALGLFVGGIVNGTVGAMIAVTATLIFCTVLYSSWLIDRTKRRLMRYIISAGQAIEREHRKTMKGGSE